MIAQWIIEILEDLEPGDIRWGLQYEAGGLVERDRQHPSPGPTVIVRAVCSKCNNGWMSDLETLVQPTLGEMIRGRAVTLTPADQVDIAAWASKTAMALEAYEPSTSVSRPEDRALVRDHCRPPEHHRIRLACRDEYFEPVLTKFSVARSASAPDDRPDTFAFTIAIGFLIVQVWGGHGAEIPSGLAQGGTKIGRAFMVWPPVPSSVSWPTAHALTDDELESFAREVIPWAEDAPGVAEWRGRRSPGP